MVLSHVAHHPAALASAAISATPATLSPPWETFRSQLAATVGKTPGVKVGQLLERPGGYTVAVTVQGVARGDALATVLTGTKQIGNVGVEVEVQRPNGHRISGITPSSSRELAQIEESALDGNPMFKTVVVRASSPYSSDETVYPVFTRSVVQFYNDDLTDLHGNANQVAAKAFANVLNLSPNQITVSPSTDH